MVWTKTDSDVVGIDEPGSAAVTFRLTDNSVARWQDRGRMVSACWDFRDPVDIASIGNFRRYIIPSIRMLPGFTILKLRLRYQVTHVEGVKVRWTVLNAPNITPSPVVLLTSLTPDNHDVVFNVSEWVRSGSGESLVLALEIESQAATSEAVIALRINSISDWFIATGQIPGGQPSLGGITDRIEACSVAFINTIKTVSIPSDETPGGPFQTVSNGVGAGGSGTDGGFYVWPKLTGLSGTLVPQTIGAFSVFNDQYDQIELQIYSRLQFWTVGIEQIRTPTFPVQGRSNRKPIIETGLETKNALRPDYPGRASTHRPLYLEGQRQFETHTTVHSIGPYSGTTGLDFFIPNPTDLRNGTWPCYPNVTWTLPDVSGKELFGVRVGQDPEFKEEGSATVKVRRSMTIDVSMIFIGGITGEHQFVLDAKTYSAGSGALVYEAPSVPFSVRPLDPTLIPWSGGRWEQLLAYSLAHPNIMDFSAPGSANTHRRNNLIGLWDEDATWNVLGRHIIQRTVEVFDPDPANADPEVLIMEVRPSVTGDLTLGNKLPIIGNIRCFAMGWHVMGKQGGTPTTTGV